MNRRNPQFAFTLLEVILALALSVFVLAAIAWAIQLHLTALDTRRGDVEESQLARAVLKMIADDLHSVLAYNTVDFSEAAQMAALDIPGLAGGDVEAGDENFELPPEDEGADGSGDEEAQDLSADLTPGTVPGIFGNQFQIQMDISRLPRLEDFDPALQAAAGGLRDLPSDAKSVAYYLQPDIEFPEEENQALFTDSEIPVGSSASPGQGWGRGLVRRSLDRAATQWALGNGDLSRLDATGEVVALEIVALEFRYFDGEQWLQAWDTTELGGLPMAVEVAIGIEADDGRENNQPVDRQTNDTLSESASTRDVRIYHQVIRIPAAQPILENAEVETDAE